MGTALASTIKKEVTGAARAFYVKGVDMRFSFDTLEYLAKENGANLDAGDVLIVDNENGTKRKMFKKTPSGSIIIYAMLKKDEFTELDRKNKAQNLLDFFDYTK